METKLTTLKNLPKDGRRDRVKEMYEKKGQLSNFNISIYTYNFNIYM